MSVLKCPVPAPDGYRLIDHPKVMTRLGDIYYSGETYVRQWIRREDGSARHLSNHPVKDLSNPHIFGSTPWFCARKVGP